MAENVVEMFRESVEKFSGNPVRKTKVGKEFVPISYKQMDKDVKNFASGLIQLGVKFGDHVGVIADNRYEWILSDISILSCGAADVPRGCDSTADEIAYIIKHSGCKIVIAENLDQVQKIKSKRIAGLKTIVVMDAPDKMKKQAGVVPLKEVMEKGEKALAKSKKESEVELRVKKIKPETLASIIYTSGTTGEPKGVMLSHGNFMHNIRAVPHKIGMTPSDRLLTLLPAWHSFQRIMEYAVLVTGASQAYTNITSISEDMALEQPTIMPAVPRIWEGIYNKIIAAVKKYPPVRQKLFWGLVGIAVTSMKNRKILTNETVLYKKNALIDGLRKVKAALVVGLLFPLNALAQKKFVELRAKTGGKMKYSVSGGGALPYHVDEFFNAIGLEILEGYGLTETSPILANRYPKTEKFRSRVVLGSVGPMADGTEIKLVDANDGSDVTNFPGAVGVIWVRGPQVMQGYYNNPKKTKEVLMEDGWFNTGDLGKLSVNGELTITGRAKDTIVLLGGENIEPTPIENKILLSDYVNQCMVIGQDKKTLGALIVPDKETLGKFVKENNIPGEDLKAWITDPKVKTLYKGIVNELVSTHTGFKAFERVTVIALIAEEFTPKNGMLTQTMKFKRNVIADAYKDTIESIYK